MARKKTIIVFPHLNDCGGDLKKQWYVEWKYRIPGEENIRKERNYKDLKQKTKEERYEAAQKIISEKTEWINSGDYLHGNNTRVYEDELMYRNEAKLYGSLKNEVVSSRTHLSEFMEFKKAQKVNKKTYETYVSKMRIFNAWLEKNKLHELAVSRITRDHIIKFATYLANDQNLSRLSIKKYIQIIHSYFDFELDRGRIPFNPVAKIPQMGRIVDMSATPFQKDERQKLKEAIEKNDPQLWIACEIQYYCAIRPGTELRLMRIGWIDFDTKKFRIPTSEAKNNNTELVDIPDFLIDRMLEIQLHKYDKSLYIFGKFGQPGVVPVGKNTLRNRFNRYREALEISPDKKFYSWKHTGAIQMLDNGIQPIDLQNHLRHKSFYTTEGYIKKKFGNDREKTTKFSSEI